MGNNDEMHVYIKRKKPALGSQEAHHVYTHRREDNQVHVYLPSGQPEPATNPHADILGQDADTGEPTQVSQDAPTAREQEPERYQPPTGYSRLGRDMQTGAYVDVAQAARLRGLYIIGLQGYGKSGLNENLIIQDIKQNIGVCVLDPHGELIKNIIARLPDREKEEKVILLDLKRKDAYIGLNLFDCTDPTDDDEITKALDLVKHVFEKAFEITQATPLMYNLLYKIAYVLIANPGCTMVDMPLFLTNEAFRKKLVHNVTDYDVRTFWENWDNPKLKSPRDQEADSQTILNKLNDFSHAPLRYIVGQSSSTIDLQKIMDEGKILLVKLDRRRETATALIGSILVALTLTASDARLTKKQFNVYADEFQRFASEDFATLLEEARKAGIGITMAHQNRSQLSAKDKELETDLKDRTRSTDNLVVFRINRKDADDLAGEFAEEPEEAKLDVLTPQKHQRIEEQVEIEVEEDIMEITHDPVDFLVSSRGTHRSPKVRQITQEILIPLVAAAEGKGDVVVDSADRKFVRSPFVNREAMRKLYHGKNVYPPRCSLLSLQEGKNLLNALLVDVMEDRIKLRSRELAGRIETIAIRLAGFIGWFNFPDFESGYGYSDYERRIEYGLQHESSLFRAASAFIRGYAALGYLPRSNEMKAPEQEFHNQLLEMLRKRGYQGKGGEYGSEMSVLARKAGASLATFVQNLHTLCKEIATEEGKIMVPTGQKRMVKRIHPHITYLTDESEKIQHPRRAEQDVVNEMARTLTNLPPYTARAKITIKTGPDEYTIKTLEIKT